MPGPKPLTDTKVFNNPTIPTWDARYTTKHNFSDDTIAAIYTYCAAQTSLKLNPLRVNLPIAESPLKYNNAVPQDTRVSITLGWTQAEITFHFECERVGDWPSLPEPVGQFITPGTPLYDGSDKTQNDGIEGNLLRATITPMPATVDATVSKKIYHVTTEYTYGLSRPPKRDEAIPVGVLPFTDFTAASNSLVLSNLYKGNNTSTYFNNDQAQQPNAGGY